MVWAAIGHSQGGGGLFLWDKMAMKDSVEYKKHNSALIGFGNGSLDGLIGKVIK